jgi:4-amino-4-deoxy-L-arabinose transferase-like glycosyltransferase
MRKPAVPSERSLPKDESRNVLLVKKNLPFIMFTITLVILVLIKPFLMYGLGGDGVVYASIAWNLAHNIGTFWQPYYLWPFFDHPPLALNIESWFFHVLGDHFWVEKFYSGVAAAVSLLGLIKLWRFSLQQQQKLQHWSFVWIPIILWLTVSVNINATKNNLLENTLVLFTTWAIYFALKSVRQHRLSHCFYLLLTGFCITAGFLTKGPQAFFVIISLMLYGLFFREFTLRQMWQGTLWIVGAIIFLLGIILLYKPAYTNLTQYWHGQFWATLSGARPGPYQGYKHLAIFWLLLQNILPLIILTLICVLLRARQLQLKFSQYLRQVFTNKWLGYFFLLGLCGTLPVVLSSRQQEPYILQAIPFFILGFSQVLTPIFYEWILKISIVGRVYQRCTFILVLLWLIVVVNTIFSYGKLGRDQSLLTDVFLLTKKIPAGSKVSASQEVLYQQDIVPAYFYRYGQIILMDNQQCTYLLTTSQETAPVDYLQVPIMLHHFVLYRNFNKAC